MKKVLAMAMMMTFATGTAAMAATPAEAAKAHYQEMKKIKDAQREVKEAKKKSEAASPEVKKPGFWDREGERSGLGQSGSRIGNAVSALNPMPFFKRQNEAYKARKADGVK